MVRAWYLDKEDSDIKLPHMTSPPKFVSVSELQNLFGVEYWQVIHFLSATRYYSYCCIQLLEQITSLNLCAVLNFCVHIAAGVMNETLCVENNTKCICLYSLTWTTRKILTKESKTSAKNASSSTKMCCTSLETNYRTTTKW